MITLELRSPHPPNVVLDSLHQRGGEWRRSQIPPELWRDGVGAVESRIRGSTCTFRFRRRWYGPVERGSRLLSAEATVLPDTGGSRVLLDIAYRNAVSPRLGMLVIAVATGIGLVLFGALGLWFLIGGLASLALQYLIVRGYNRHPTRLRAADADYLLARLEYALASAGELINN